MTDTMKLSSPAFGEGDPIPEKYTCQGDDVSPPLEWTGAPDTTESFALICDDPDAPGEGWVHWVLYNLPGGTTELPEQFPAKAALPYGVCQGLNDFNKTGYGGPCPPPGKAHRYYFKLYALDSQLDLGPKAVKSDLVDAMEGHVLAKGQWMGTYLRW